ncbi:xylulokinase [Lachnospiraceae bacterium]|nr:xylulokinase [Lachnospiraceae bacterium]
MGCYMGVDLGTSSMKTIIIDESGRVLGIDSESYQFASPFNNYAEQEPEDWWKACVMTIRGAMQKGGLKGDDIKGISFSGQMHGLVTLDKDLKSVRPTILHCDARSIKQIDEIKELFGEKKIRELMMNPVYTGFLLPSLLWVRENEPENFEKISHVCLPKDYLKVKLTGDVTSDYADASATLAFDIKNGRWSNEILEKIGFPIEWFPECYETCDVVGTVTREAAEETGLSPGTPVIAGGGDQVMQQIGNGITKVGQASANIGTSGQVSFQSSSPILNPRLSTNTFIGYKKDHWFTMGAIMNAGLCFKWFNSIFEKVDYEELNTDISKVSPGSGGVIFLPYLNGERTPHLDPNLSGAFIGVNLRTGKPQLERAVMEGVSFAMNQCIEVCEELGLHADTIIASGGGSHSIPWLHIQSDIYNRPLKVADTDEQAGLGAAIAAGVGAGTFCDIDEGCERVVRYKDFEILPDAKNHEIYMEYYQIYKEAFHRCCETLHEVTLLGRKKR